VVDYVLRRPSRDDAIAIEDAIDRAEGTLPDLLSGTFQKAMHRLHSAR